MEKWWKHTFFPDKTHLGARLAKFVSDGLIAVATAAVWIGLLVALGFGLPFLFWNARIGFVACVHLNFPLRIGALPHHIMEHTAHHVNISIPRYELEGAQQLLETTLPERITVRRFSWRWYVDTSRRCERNDFSRRCWTDFEGRPASDRQTAAVCPLLRSDGPPSQFSTPADPIGQSPRCRRTGSRCFPQRSRCCNHPYPCANCARSWPIVWR